MVGSGSLQEHKYLVRYLKITVEIFEDQFLIFKCIHSIEKDTLKH